ncbi:hypothetical protein [Mesorhizobium sp. NZP2077]|uniref:hypothetical protein n=1 Tax=Mesorhizobium sp. NZP2077 TaxID=2483404 RepID=UPI001557AB8C|nr:hypothetical protein [Mesorhizobium sp. NZP2077]QKC84384.1 hypothetical protein EB232_24815 [Mesorhizobium sp. NZP2077]QKD17946.1 hypothetical protein HGP13_24520 [Mesorhizobium sp. NZP2077]
MQLEYTLADLTRIVGAKRRTIQLWAEAGAIKADDETERAGTGTHRRFSRREALIACLLKPFADYQMSIGFLIGIADSIRDEGAAAWRWELLERAIQDESMVYMLLRRFGHEFEIALIDVNHVGTSEYFQDRHADLGALITKGGSFVAQDVVPTSVLVFLVNPFVSKIEK